MRRLVTLIMVLIALSMLTGPVVANNGNGNGNGDDSGTVWNKKKCEEAGGFWFNERGVKSCNKIQAEDAEIPDDAWDDTGIDWDIVQAYYERDPDDRHDDTSIIVIVVFYEIDQRGNVGAPGTSATLQWWPTCETSPLAPIIPPEVCAILAKGPVL